MFAAFPRCSWHADALVAARVLVAELSWKAVGQKNFLRTRQIVQRPVRSFQA